MGTACSKSIAYKGSAVLAMLKSIISTQLGFSDWPCLSCNAIEHAMLESCVQSMKTAYMHLYRCCL